MPQLNLSLLGAFQAHLDGNLLTGFQSNKARGLLAYLAVEGEQPHQRDKLAGLFWPNWTDSQARAHLRHALNNLRNILGDKGAATPFLLANRHTIQFNLSSEHRLDVARFSDCLTLLPDSRLNEAAVTQLKREIEVYTGAFLAGFFLPDCPEFEDWVQLTRRRLHDQQRHRLQWLIHYFETAGAFETAIIYARHWVDHDPPDEDGHARLMRLLAYTGQRSAALTQYEQCRQILADDLGVEPTDQTTALHQQIQQGRLKPPLPATPKPSTLPAQITAFIGRVAEQQAICHLLRRKSVRLLTLHGPGGVGKTRLGLQVGQHLQPEFADGIYFVSLAPLPDPSLLISTIAKTLDVRETGSQNLEQALKARLKSQQTLLILDNFEHLLPAASVVTDLLAAAADLKILVTSRQTLHLYGEYEYAVPPLAVPDDQPSLAQLAQSDALQLFAERALAVNPNFRLDDETIPLVAQICTRLDGLPLAIELAAAHIKRFTPAQLLAQLTTSATMFPLLSNGPRDKPARQQTLSQTIDWSYHLLREPEQILFRRLAVFVGGFVLEAVEAVCNFDATLSIDIRAGLEDLVDKNLLRQVSQPDGETRFMLLETIREYGLAQLQAADEVDQLKYHHLRFYTQLVVGFQQNSISRLESHYFARLALEHENLRLALQTVLNNQDRQRGMQLVGVLYVFWLNGGYISEWREWIVSVIDMAADAPPSIELARALFGAGFLFNGLGDMVKAQHYFSKSLAVSRQIDDQAIVGISLALLGNTCYKRGDVQAGHRYHQESLIIRRAEGNDWATGMLLINMGLWAMRWHQLKEAQALLMEGRGLLQKVNNYYGLTIAAIWLSGLSRQLGDCAQGHRYLAEGRRINQLDGSKPLAAGIQFEAGRLALAEEDYAQAGVDLVQALTSYNKLNEKLSIASIFEVLAELAWRQEEVPLTFCFAGVAAKLHTSLGTVPPPVDRANLDQVLAAARDQLGSKAAAKAYAEGEGMSLDEAITLAKRIFRVDS